MRAFFHATGLFAGVLFLTAVSLARADAATLNIDFGDGPVYNSVGAAPDPGTIWNAVGPSGSGSATLLYSNGINQSDRRDDDHFSRPIFKLWRTIQ